MRLHATGTRFPRIPLSHNTCLRRHLLEPSFRLFRIKIRVRQQYPPVIGTRDARGHITGRTYTATQCTNQRRVSGWPGRFWTACEWLTSQSHVGMRPALPLALCYRGPLLQPHRPPPATPRPGGAFSRCSWHARKIQYACRVRSWPQRFHGVIRRHGRVEIRWKLQLREALWPQSTISPLGLSVWRRRRAACGGATT